VPLPDASHASMTPTARGGAFGRLNKWGCAPMPASGSDAGAAAVAGDRSRSTASMRWRANRFDARYQMNLPQGDNRRLTLEPRFR